MKARVLVTDAEQRSALAIVRALGRAGHEVIVCSSRVRPLAGASRYAHGSAVVADALTNPDAFVDDLARLAKRSTTEVLLPVTEPALLAVLAARDRFPGVRIPFPSLEVFRQTCDKAHVLACAADVGIRSPEQRVIASRDEWLDGVADELSYPLVLKPSRSVGEGRSGRVKQGVMYATDAAALRAHMRSLGDEAFPLLLQQRIVGSGTGVFLLVWEGRVIARFAHQRLREKPPSGGISVYAESVPFDDELGERSRALLERLGWQGVAMVEFKRDGRTGVPYLMEINGRFWGSLQLAIDAGVDFPVLLVEAALGRPAVAPPSYRAGVRTRWWWGDIDHLLIRLRRNGTALALPPDAPGRGRALLDFLRIRASDHNEVFRVNDPAPFLRESMQWFTRR
jgi:predicted ATP-grasp superfamily ATP-dependent carboligase